VFFSSFCDIDLTNDLLTTLLTALCCIFLHICCAYNASSCPNATWYISIVDGLILLIISAVSGRFLTKFSSSCLKICCCFCSSYVSFFEAPFLMPDLACWLMLDSTLFHLFLFCRYSCSFRSIKSCISCSYYSRS